MHAGQEALLLITVLALAVCACYRLSIQTPRFVSSLHTSLIELRGVFCCFPSWPTNIMSDAESPVPQETNNVNPSSGNLSLRNVSRVNLQIRNLTVYPDPKPSVWTKITERVNHSLRPHLLRPNAAVEPLLEDVSTDIPAGSLTAIIGGSGSGKTTLLNSISHRLSSKKLKVTGKILFNGHENSRSVRSSYVMQQDVLLPVLTVRETLQYAADLRLLPPSTENERKDAVNAVILELGLKECAETRVGNKVRRGCSGGEKRRTSIGVQMIANPSLLFCDEPTTGRLEWWSPR